MINEKMLELLLLRDFIKIPKENYEESGLDKNKLAKRYYELVEEFLKPYVIENAEKSE